MIISEKIVYLRKREGLTQEELAEKLNVSRQSISKWESAQSIPDVTKIMAMADIFSVTTDYMLRDDIESIEGEVAITLDKSDKQTVTIEKANGFIDIYEKRGKNIAISIFLFIVSCVPVLFMECLTELKVIDSDRGETIGVVFLFTLVTVGVGILIYNINIKEDYLHIKNGEFELSNNVEGIIREYKKNYKPKSQKLIIIGVSGLILSPLVFVVGEVIAKSEAFEDIYGAIFMGGVAVCVGILVYNAYINSSYDLLLQTEGDYNARLIKNRKKYENLGIVAAINISYWIIITGLYMLISLLTRAWGITWIIWLVSPAIIIIINVILYKKK